MTLTEEQKAIRRDFRTYLRTKGGQKGNMLNNLINAAENRLPALIRNHFNPDFQFLYDDAQTIEELITYSKRIRSDENILAGPFGYICSKVLDGYVRYYADKNGVNLDDIYLHDEESSTSSRESDEEQQRIEGRLTESKILRRQRNRAARQKCLEDSRYTCYVCGFNFEKVYGELGKNFLEVHHTKPMATYDDEHPIPQSELCALCSNCHSMVHRKREVLDGDDLKKVFEENKLAK